MNPNQTTLFSRRWTASVFVGLRFGAALVVPWLSLHAAARAQSDALTIFPSQQTGVTFGGPFVQAGDGNFYNTSQIGGANHNGAVFQLTPEGVATVIYSFTALDGNGFNADGAGPYAGLTLGRDGNLYGTTGRGGSQSYGTLFQVTTTGQFKTVANLVASVDQARYGPLVQASNGNFFGVSNSGGPNGVGDVFQVTPGGDVSVVHFFSAVGDDATNADGAQPLTGVGIDSADNLYGTTTIGGANGDGTVYEISAGGGFATLYSFPTASSQSGGNLSGESTTGPIVVTPDGTVYATAQDDGPNFGGTIYKVSGGGFTVLYSFSAYEMTSTNADGALPYGLTLGHDGNLYGSTGFAGPNGSGTIFQITPGGDFTVLYSPGAANEGFMPPVQGTDGNLYGYGALGGTGPFYRLDATTVPVITSAATLNAPVGTAVSYQIAATNTPTGYEASGLPAGLTLDPKTGLITGIATATATASVQLGATNAEGTGYAALTITVAPASPFAPVVAVPSSPVMAQLNNPFALQIVSTNTPSAYAALGLPPGLSLNKLTGLISGVATAQGRYPVQVTATNASGVGTATLEIDVAAAAAVPTVTVVGSNPDANATTGQTGDFTLTLSAVAGVDVVVAYTVKGSAIPGTDYDTLKGTVKIKAGKTSKNIKVVPAGNLGGATKKVVKLTLQAGTGYTVGTTDPVKVKIIATP